MILPSLLGPRVLVQKLFAVALACQGLVAAESATWKFDFGGGPATDGRTIVATDTAYSVERGFGFEPSAGVRTATHSAGATAITSDAPFLFSAAC